MSVHGTPSCYNGGCRCEECRAVHSAYTKAYCARKRQERLATRVAPTPTDSVEIFEDDGWYWRRISNAGQEVRRSRRCDTRYTAVRTARRQNKDLIVERTTLEQRFMSKVRKTTSCWLWTGSCNRDGYGDFGVQRQTKRAHRVSYEMLVGPIPDGTELDHLCRVRNCVRPDHLEPVSHRVNMLRGEGAGSANAAKKTCPQGHPYDRHDGRSRRCGTCNKERGKRRWQEELQRRKAAA